ncbi:aspartate kinase [Hymenobacter sp. B81]|uniref:aspartate kinase n=1 Tax=Hymenobacter sp. B81 TaxID=3344878 RepID=UPI0037DD6D62
MKVLKFGGTSVGSAQRMRALPALLPTHEPIIVVLSAMAGTTNALVDIARRLYAADLSGAIQQIENLRQHYRQLAWELLPEAAVAAEACTQLDTAFDTVQALARQPLTAAGERVILAQGELLSTLLFHRYCTAMLGREAVLLPALEFMRLDENAEPAAGFIQEQLTSLLARHAGQQLFITQGYICRNAQGQVDNLKRGGSDYSASLIGAAVRAQEIQIWTDIDGLHNNDPRVVEGTYPIRELSFDEAAELAYFGAKILHPSSVLPAREHGIPVRLLNTLQPQAPGTLISARTGHDAIKAVAAKDGLTALKVKSSRRLPTPHFLGCVFGVFERHRTSIDMITTSEVAVSLTIDDATHLPAILDELRRIGEVEVDEQQTIICLVGNLVQEQPGLANAIFRALRRVPLRMISYGGSAHNVSVLVHSADKERTLRALNQELFAAGSWLPQRAKAPASYAAALA